MTPEQAPERLAYATYWAIKRYGLDGIFRARWVEATGRWKQERQITLIAAQQHNQYPRVEPHSMFPPPTALRRRQRCSSMRNCSLYRAHGTPTAPWRATQTTSHGDGRRAVRCRKVSRRQRLVRLRTPALPIRLETAIPRRERGSEVGKI